jgi:Cu/Zn superoxide dismutase
VAAIDKTFGGVKVQEVLGRGIVVHADPDDGSQPTGNAGGRIAFGVIGIANVGS